MHEDQPQLPFGEGHTLEEIRRLLETQNDLLRALVDRLEPRLNADDPLHAVLDGNVRWVEEDDEYDPFDEEDEDEVYELHPEPPQWFARHFHEG